ncbi:hypothetical protein [Shewanella psychrophila]|nr:hypothetical protein [Shewanella psychrophila]
MSSFFYCTILSLCSSSVFAEHFNVFCHNNYDDSLEYPSEKITYNAPLMQHNINSESKYFYYVYVSEDKYNKFKAKCSGGTVPRPVAGKFSSWKVFSLKNENYRNKAETGQVMPIREGIQFIVGDIRSMTSAEFHF